MSPSISSAPESCSASDSSHEELSESLPAAGSISVSDRVSRSVSGSEYVSESESESTSQPKWVSEERVVGYGYTVQSTMAVEVLVGGAARFPILIAVAID